MLALLLTAFTVALGYFLLKSRRPPGFPPGPPCLPIVGSIPFIKNGMLATATKWQKQYGNTLSFQFGREFVVMLSDFSTVKKALSEDSLAGRIQNLMLFAPARKYGKVHGVLQSEGELWKVHRRFALSALRDFGMGKTWLEDAVLAEVEDLCRQIEHFDGEPVNPRTLISHGVSNVICALVFGQRFSHDDERFRELLRLMNELTQIASKTAVLEVVPFLKHIPFGPRKYLDQFTQINEETVDFIRKLIEEHERRGTEAGRNDFIDAYMIERKKPNSDKDLFTDFQLIRIIFDLFAAGTETSSTTTLWSLLYMMRYPEVLRKIQEEMDGHVSEDDLLPYTDAAICEVQRMASLVLFNVPHKTTAEMSINGYIIPAQTVVMTNIHAIHHDPRLWDQPDTFQPSRFLDADRKPIRPDGLIPFSVGKRSCLGESLARMELWLFIANLLHRFDLSPIGKVDLTMDPSASASGLSTPLPFEMSFKRRGH